MKFVSVLLLTGIAALAGCSTTANNGTSNATNANMRGTNTNTAYVTNSDTNVKPTMPANVTNISPGGGTSTNTGSVSNARNSNMNSNSRNGSMRP